MIKYKWVEEVGILDIFDYTKSKRTDSHARVHTTGMSWAHF